MKYPIALLLAVALLLSACATNTGNVSADTRGRVTNAVLKDVFNTVVSAGIQYGVSSLTGQNGQDAAEAAFLSAGQANGVSAFRDIEAAYAGPQIKPVVDVALDAIAKANPQSAADRVLVLNTVGAAIQSVANQYAAK